MSKPATTKPQQPATKPQFPSGSAWNRGPPKSTSAPSPRSQSPAPTHSRRPSTLGQGVPIKDGVTIPRGNASALKAGKYSFHISTTNHSSFSFSPASAVTFGSIDDVSAPISSSPASAPPIKTESVKSFGTVDAVASAAPVNGKPSVSSRPTASSSSTPPPSSNPPTKLAKGDILKMFQNPSSAPSSSAPSSSTTSDTSSPSVRPANLPPQSSSQAPSTQPPPQQHPPFTPFVPSSARPHQSTGPAARTPSSPVYSRQIPNGNAPRPQPGPNTAQIPSGMSSPRLGPHPHNGPPAMPPNMPPQMQQQVPMSAWPNPYYAYPTPDQSFMYWGYTNPNMPPHHQQPPPHGAPHNGMPMSPRSQPPPLTPGTPTQAHAVPSSAHPQHPPSQHSHTASNSISFTSPPPTPSTATTRLSASSSAFVPGNRPTRVTLKNAEGHEVDISSFASKPSPSPASGSSSPAPRTGAFRHPSPSSPVPAKKSAAVVRLESEEQNRKRLAEEEKKKKEEEGVKAKAEAEEKERKDKERKDKEDKERKEKEEKERKEREETERIRKEEEEKERVKKEAEAEAERLRKEEEEKARIAKEEEQKRKEEEERAKEEAERVAKEAEAEKERLRLEEEAVAKAKAEAEAAVAASATAESTDKPIEEEEEGEVAESEQVASPTGDESSKDKPRGPLRIDTATALPTDFPKRIRPGALDLSGAKASNPDMPAAPPSAISLANPIRDLDAVSYPAGIQSPDPKLNVGRKDGQFRYDRDFLMQFMMHCKEKPENLDLNLIGLEANSNQEMHPMSRGGSGRHGRSTSGAPTSRQVVGLGIGGFGKGSNSIMGNFVSPGSKLSSEQRFQESARSVSMGGAPFGRPSPMTRSSSQGGVGGMPMSTGRVRSKRGEKRGDGNKAGGYGHGQSNAGPALTEPFVPLKVSENRWDRKAITSDDSNAAVVERKVKSLLNKLTMEKFDSISDQIIEWANKSESQADGNTLMQVIGLVFEKATDEAAWSEMYARLCRKMMERISSSVRDETILVADNKPIAGGQLFRKYLLNRCQEEFEHGWAVKEATAEAAAKKAAEDQAVKDAQEKNGGSDEVALYSDEYYAAQKAKRRGLGLIRFIGELFKLQMLTERIMHECLKKLLGNVDNPEEEDIESCCKLMMTVGFMLDTARAANHMSVYFARITELKTSPLVSSRIKFMLQDVLELREKKWVSRNVVAVPTTIAQVHETAAKEKAAAEKDALTRQISMSRSSSRRGGDRGNYPQVGPDGWAVAGGNGPSRPSSNAGDLSNFGNIKKSTSISFGPSSVFAGKKGGENKRDSVPRTSSSSNMFSMLSQGAEPAAEPKAPEPQRKRLVLQPRTKPTSDDAAAKSESEVEESEAEPSAVEMSEEQALKKIGEDSKEFFAVRNLDEAEVYFTNLPAMHHFRLVDKFTSHVIESKETNVVLLSQFFARAVEKELCAATAFEEGFMPIAEVIDDIAIDAPKAFDFFAMVVKSAALSDESKARLAGKSMDEDKLLALLS